MVTNGVWAYRDTFLYYKYTLTSAHKGCGGAFWGPAVRGGQGGQHCNNHDHPIISNDNHIF